MRSLSTSSKKITASLFLLLLRKIRKIKRGKTHSSPVSCQKCMQNDLCWGYEEKRRVKWKSRGQREALQLIVWQLGSLAVQRSVSCIYQHPREEHISGRNSLTVWILAVGCTWKLRALHNSDMWFPFSLQQQWGHTHTHRLKISVWFGREGVEGMWEVCKGWGGYWGWHL